jgi:hypothetical protein
MLSKNLGENEAGQTSASSVRESSEKAFQAMEEDLVKAIGQMEEAIEVLTAISLGQTKTATFRDKFMAGSSKGKKDAALLNLGQEVRSALNAASALLPAGSIPDSKSLQAFLQAPLAAAHSHQGDAIVGILKNLKSTFETNLENARSSENVEKKAFEDSINVLKSSQEKLEKSSKEKEQEMGSNDGELSSKKTSLEEAEQQKANDEEFLQTLRDSAEKKAKDYEERKMLRANEDAAIAEAVSLLNSDAAFATFGTVDATSKGETSFLQRRVRHGIVWQQAELVL